MAVDCFYAWKERIEKKRKKEINKMKLKDHLKKKNGELIQKCFYLFCKYAIQHAKWVQARFIQQRKNELLQKAFNNWVQFKNESKDNEYIEIQVNIKEKVLMMKDEQQEEQSIKTYEIKMLEHNQNE
ncbi:hypothetical protein PPERSA_01674 [Pseudocohnilembus persalinus]|uniref:Uncharacterized protein n=1 Tax=Pseudocohnilembus persalinus TaxID=266149 RepID=A0A0V0R0X1_PSEPJ|nr:hypothetical protein PPERSA_01674 [Pseudocohnilembus persalinus]|eukprot:KRX08129.1 hypothetical protein PPERSA_01674 [Pseudocohnilembus persalinus]